MKIKERVVVFPDIHFPNHYEPALKCALKVIKEIKPSGFVLLGDTADGSSVSKWQWSKKKRPPIEYQIPAIEKEIKQVNAGIDRIDEVLDKVNCKKKIYTQGNHEKWFDNFVDENPFLDKYGCQKAFKWKERGYNYNAYGQKVRVFKSKLFAYHGGHFMGINHTRSHLQNLGANIIYGHTHDAMKAVITHIDGPIMAHSMGCLTDMTKDYLQNRNTNWTHNVGIIDIFDDGNFNLQVLQIIDNVTSYAGKIIKG